MRLEFTVGVVAMLILLSDQYAAELRTAGGHIPRPADQLHDGVLVDGLTFPANWNKVTIFVRTEENVVRVQRPHMRGSRTA